MSMSLAAWVAAVDGKTIGSGECVALTNSYNTEVVGSPPVPTTGDSYAITQYESFPTGGMNQWYSRVDALGPFKAGDQLFWRRGSSTAPLSHTAVALADLGPVLKVCSQNTAGHRYAEVTTLPRAGVAGALRPINPGAVSGTVPASWLDDVTGAAGAAGAAVGAAGTLAGLATVWGNILTWLTSAENWRRIGIALLGIILIMVALLKILNFTPGTAVTGLTKAVTHG